MQYRQQLQKSRFQQLIQENQLKNFDFHILIDAIKMIKEVNVIEVALTQAKMEFRQNQQLKNNSQKLVQLAKKSNQIEIKCSNFVSREQLKCLQKNLPDIMHNLNQQSSFQTLAYKIYFDIRKKMMTIQTCLFTQLILSTEKKDLSDQIYNIIKQSYKYLKQVSKIITQKKKLNQVRINTDLLKLKESFEQNRMKRQKSTKICLLSKKQNNILSKIVMSYKDDIQRNTLLARRLYATYKQQKLKLQKQRNYQGRINQAIIKKNRFLADLNDSSENTQKDSEFLQRSQKNLVIKPILISFETLVQNLQPGGFGSIGKYEVSYQQLFTFSHQSQRYMEHYCIKNNIEIQRRASYQVLIKKQPLNTPYGAKSFQNQLACLSYLRNQHCSQIAQYYNPVISTDRQQDGIKRFLASKHLYSKFYQADLSTFQKSKTQNRLKIMGDLMEFIKFLSQFFILHRDLKPSNIRLNKKGKVKVIDFGSACRSFGNSKFTTNSIQDERFCFSPTYTLEYFKANLSNMSYQQYTKHILYDMYAFGKICEGYFAANKGDPQFLVQNIQYLYKKCMEYNPDDRLQPYQVLVFLKSLLKYFSLPFK